VNDAKPCQEEPRGRPCIERPSAERGGAPIGLAIAACGALLFALFNPPEDRYLASPRINIKYYDIEGSTPEELRRSLDAQGPLDRKGIRRYAYTRWRIWWNWPRRGTGPDFSRCKADYQAEVFLPRWKRAKRAEPKLQASWNEFLNAMVHHEMEHVDSARLNYQSVAKRVQDAFAVHPDLSEAEAEAIAQEELTRIRLIDWTLDRRTKHGKTEGVELRDLPPQ